MSSQNYTWVTLVTAKVSSDVTSIILLAQEKCNKYANKSKTEHKKPTPATEYFSASSNMRIGRDTKAYKSEARLKWANTCTKVVI